MRIAVCGPHRDGVIKSVESSLHTNVVKPWNVGADGKFTIVDLAAETYKHFDEKNVVFDGCAFDFIGSDADEGYNEVYEQVALGTLVNLDYIVVITRDMDRNLVKAYNDYAKVYPDKFIIYSAENEFELVVR